MSTVRMYGGSVFDDDMYNVKNLPTRDPMGKAGVCIHPQIAYRGGSFSASDFHDLSIEITLPFVEYESYFQLTHKQIVNVSSLALHMNDPNYNAKDAILQ